ncbi:MAG: Thiosulfate sulfurtransferase GlpE [Syntrophus sp. SKADARSKE-3]|nr:Thiosulfate sulfurtransferase GlpE [Syntrophus sp. SKADARSKE-3]
MNRECAILIGFIIILAIGVTEGAFGEAKTLQRIDAKALIRMIDNRESVIPVHVGGYLECMDAMISGSLCGSCDQDNSIQLPPSKETKLVFYDGSVPLTSECRIIEEAVRQGYSRLYILKGGLPGWRRLGYDIVSTQRVPRVSIISIKPKDIDDRSKNAGNLLILDIRSADAFKNNHIKDAMNISMSLLHLRYQEIPLDRPVVVVDEDGSRSFLAASYLFRKGFKSIERLAGGMSAWDAYVKKGSKK